MLYKTTVVLFFFCMTMLCCATETATPSKVETPESESGFWEDFVNFFLPHAEKRQILLSKQTQYFMVTVEQDSAGLRHLVFNPIKGSQGVWNPKKPNELISNYAKYMTLFIPMTATPPERVLFIGLGIGILPRFVEKHFPDAVIDIVEIDPDIPDIANKYFGYEKSGKTNIIIKDGRDFINRVEHKYDLIFIDAYNSREIPFQLTTLEFYRKVRSALKPHGIVTVNIANLGKPNFIASELKTIKSVFPRFDVYVCPRESNYIPFASVNGPISLTGQEEKVKKVDSNLNLDYKLEEILETRMSGEDLEDMIEDGIILTDDYAPVETME